MASFIFSGSIFSQKTNKEGFAIYSFNPGMVTSEKLSKQGWESETGSPSFKGIWERSIGAKGITMALPKSFVKGYFGVGSKFGKLRIFIHNRSKPLHIAETDIEFDNVLVTSHVPLNQFSRGIIKGEQMNYMHNKQGLSRDEILPQMGVHLMVDAI